MSVDYKAPTFDSQNIPTAIQDGTYTLIDLQWRFAVTAQHSLIVNHTQCLIQIRLELQQRQNGSLKILHLQLTMAEFNQFFREMEKVSNMLSIIN